MAKRSFDFVIALVLLILLAPVFLLVGLAIRLESPGPVIFRQRRIGLYGAGFIIYKFRTMAAGAENEYQPGELDHIILDEFYFKKEDDSRLTRIGVALRKTSLDELPQLFNVVLGQMSLVGPRPEIPAIVIKYNDEQRKRLQVKPGITGLAQVCGRGELTKGKTIDYDLEYIDRRSFILDLLILVKTIRVVLYRKGAY